MSWRSGWKYELSIKLINVTFRDPENYFAFKYLDCQILTWLYDKYWMFCLFLRCRKKHFLHILFEQVLENSALSSSAVQPKVCEALSQNDFDDCMLVVCGDELSYISLDLSHSFVIGWARCCAVTNLLFSYSVSDTWNFYSTLLCR